MKKFLLTSLTVLSAIIFSSCGTWWDATTGYDYFVDPTAPPPPPVGVIGNVPVYYPNYNYTPAPPPPPSYNPGYAPGYNPPPKPNNNKPNYTPAPPVNNSNGGMIGNPGNGNGNNNNGQRPGSNSNNNGGTHNGKRPGSR